MNRSMDPSIAPADPLNMSTSFNNFSSTRLYFPNPSLFLLFHSSLKQPGRPEDRNRKDAEALKEKLAKKKKQQEEEAKKTDGSSKVARKKVAKKETPSRDSLLDEGLKKKAK